MENSYSAGAASGNTSVGGLVGSLLQDVVGSGSWISNSYSTGDVNGSSYIGGLVGTIIRARLEYAYATGVVNGEEMTGGLIGHKDQNATVERSFWNMETTGQDESDGGTGLTTVEMIDLSTFTDRDWNITAVPSIVDRDTDYIWNIVDQETYPFHSWQDLVLVPHQEMTIAIEGNGTTEPDEGDHLFIFNSEITMTATPAENWRFSHWSGDVPEGEEESEEITIVMDRDKFITAHFVRQEYILAIEVEGDGTTDPAPANHTYEYEDGVTVTAIPSNGWRFSYRSGDVPLGLEANETITIFVDGNKNIVAHFEELLFVPEDLELIVSPVEGEAPLNVTITVRGNNNGLLEGALEVIIDGTVVHTLIIPAEGSAEHNLTYTFETPGTYELEFDELFESVIVREAQPDDDDDNGVPDDDDNGDEESAGMDMWIWLLPLVAILVLTALLFFIKKKGRTGSESLDDEEELVDDGGHEEEDTVNVPEEELSTNPLQ